VKEPRYSIIIPVYNRPQEVAELLASLTQQSYKNFEVLIVEDGSSQRCDVVVDHYRDKLSIQYYFKPNSGPGPSRNYGYKKAQGEYFIVFDSDCIIPPDYLMIVENHLGVENLAYGRAALGPLISLLRSPNRTRSVSRGIGWSAARSER
jgi:glycosyltransferase involved in cell wall biosynthesis